MSDSVMSKTRIVRVAAQPAATRGRGSQDGGGATGGGGLGRGTGVSSGTGTGKGKGVSTGKIMNTGINTGIGVSTGKGIGKGVSTGKIMNIGVNTGTGVCVNTGKVTGNDTGVGIGINTGKGIGTGVSTSTGKDTGAGKGSSTMLRRYAATHQKATPQKSAQKTTRSYGAYSVTVPDQKKRSDLQKKAAAELAALEKLKRRNIGHVSITPSTVGGTLTQEEVRRKQQLDFSKAETTQAEQSGQQSPA